MRAWHHTIEVTTQCGRDVNETLAYETETRPRRDRDIRFLIRDETETKTFLQFHETETRRRRLIFATRRDRDRDFARPRPRRFSRPSTFGPFGHNRHGPKIGVCAPPPFFGGGAGSPSNTRSRGLRRASIPSGILIHLAVVPPPLFLGGGHNG